MSLKHLSYQKTKRFKQINAYNYMKKIAKRVLFVILIILSILIIILILRRFNKTQLDDVSPFIQCDEDLLDKTNIYYVIPKFQGIPISENKSWCEYILSKNKTLRMHGIEHTYFEFWKKEISTEEINGAKEIFKECFGFYPEKFKAPQDTISIKNSINLKKSDLNLDIYLNCIIHRVYHCNDTGKIKNKLADKL